jgi:hypothetical protein
VCSIVRRLLASRRQPPPPPCNNIAADIITVSSSSPRALLLLVARRVCSPLPATLPPSALLGARRLGVIVDAFIADRRALLPPISCRLSLHSHRQPLLALAALINGWLLRPLSAPSSAARSHHCPPCPARTSILRAPLSRR